MIRVFHRFHVKSFKNRYDIVTKIPRIPYVLAKNYSMSFFPRILEIGKVNLTYINIGT
jgi:hypothetical protein